MIDGALRHGELHVLLADDPHCLGGGFANADIHWPLRARRHKHLGERHGGEGPAQSGLAKDRTEHLGRIDPRIKVNGEEVPELRLRKG